MTSYTVIIRDRPLHYIVCSRVVLVCFGCIVDGMALTDGRVILGPQAWLGFSALADLAAELRELASRLPQ